MKKDLVFLIPDDKTKEDVFIPAEDMNGGLYMGGIG